MNQKHKEIEVQLQVALDLFFSAINDNDTVAIDHFRSKAANLVVERDNLLEVTAQ